MTFSGLLAPRPRFARPGRASSSPMRRPWCSSTCLCPLPPQTRQWYATAAPFFGEARLLLAARALPAPGAAGDAAAGAAAPLARLDRLCFFPEAPPEGLAMCTLAVAPPSSSPAHDSHRACEACRKGRPVYGRGSAKRAAGVGAPPTTRENGWFHALRKLSRRATRVVPCEVGCLTSGCSGDLASTVSAGETWGGLRREAHVWLENAIWHPCAPYPPAHTHAVVSRDICSSDNIPAGIVSSRALIKPFRSHGCLLRRRGRKHAGLWAALHGHSGGRPHNETKREDKAGLSRNLCCGRTRAFSLVRKAVAAELSFRFGANATTPPWALARAAEPAQAAGIEPQEVIRSGVCACLVSARRAAGRWTTTGRVCAPNGAGGAQARTTHGAPC